jgi:quinol monooxygenase YgiN
MAPLGVTAPARGGKHISVVYALYGKPGLEKLLLDELRALIQRSRKEAGCLLFDLYRLTGDHSRFFLHEVWKNHDALEVHSSNFHTTRFRAEAAHYLKRPVEIFEVEEIR